MSASLSLPNTPARSIDAIVADSAELERVTNGWLKTEIATLDQAKQAQDLDVMLLRAIQNANVQRETERKPHLDAAAAIQRLYAPVLDRLAVCRDVIGGKLRAWKTREQQRIDAEKKAAQERATEAARKAEEARKKAEAPKSVADVTNAQRLADEAVEAAKAAEAAPTRVQVRGSVSGRASGLRKYRHAEIEDMDEAYIYFKDSPDLRECLIKLANAYFRIHGEATPGCRIVEEWR